MLIDSYAPGNTKSRAAENTVLLSNQIQNNQRYY